MTAERPTFHWYLPTTGDGHDVGDLARSHMSSGQERTSHIDYLSQVARATDHLGYTGVLTPVGSECDEAWVIAAALARETRRLTFMVALRPSGMLPTLAAQMAATLQNLSEGRLALNVVAGGNITDLRRFGIPLEHDARYCQAEEFLRVMRGAWRPEGFTFSGDHFDVVDARVLHPPVTDPLIYFGGASEAAEEVAVRHADVYLMWGEPPEMLAARVERMRQLADRHERRLRLGVRFQIISRDTSEEAWAEADRMLAAISQENVVLSQRLLGRHDSVGQRRLNQLHGGDRDNLVLAPNLWAGLSLVRGHGSTALVGSHEEVAARLREHHEMGFDEFILGGFPHLEEAYRFHERVLPLLDMQAPSEARVASLHP